MNKKQGYFIIFYVLVLIGSGACGSALLLALLTGIPFIYHLTMIMAALVVVFIIFLITLLLFWVGVAIISKLESE